MLERNNQDQQWRLQVLLLKEIAESKGVTQKEIADQTGLLQSNISRFFGAKYTPRFDIFLQIAKAVGVNFYFEDKDGKADMNIVFEKAMTTLGRRPDKLPKN